MNDKIWFSSPDLVFNIIVCVFFSYTFFSCTKKIESPIKIIDVDAAKELIGVNYSSLIDTLIYVPLQTTQGSIIGSMDKVVVNGNDIYILDSYTTGQIYHFDKRGNFISLIGKHGKGPGELSHPIDFTVSNDLVVVLDGNSKKIVSFNRESGIVQKEQFLDFFPQKVGHVRDEFVFVEGSRGYKAVVTDSLFEILNRQFAFNYLNAKDHYYPFNELNDSLLLYRSYLSDTIFQLYGKDFIPYRILNLGPKGISSNDWYAFAQKKRFIQKDELFNFHYGIKYYTETDSHIYFIYSAGDVFNCVLYDKSEDKSVLFTHIGLINDITFEGHVPVIVTQTSDQWFVAQAVPVKPNDSSPYSEKYNNSMALFKNQDFSIQNDLLILIRFKPFK